MTHQKGKRAEEEATRETATTDASNTCTSAFAWNEEADCCHQFESPKAPSKAPRINNNSLHPNTGSLRCRLNHFGCFHSPMPSQSKHPSCALHRWLMGRDPGSHSQIRGHVVCCTACKVNLCTQCFHVFHTVKDIVGEKVELSSMLLD